MGERNGSARLAVVSGELGRLVIDAFSQDDVRALVEDTLAGEQAAETLGLHDAAAHRRRVLQRLRLALGAEGGTQGRTLVCTKCQAPLRPQTFHTCPA